MKKEKRLNAKETLLSSAIPLWGSILANQYQKKIGLSTDLKANRHLIKMGFKFGRECFKRNAEKQKMVWVNLPNVSEIFCAFDVIPYTPEPYAGSTAAMGTSSIFLDEAYGMGFSRDTCTFCNHVLGANNLDQLPKPDMIIATMFTLCDAQGKAFEAAARQLNIPFKLIHLPSMNHSKSTEQFFVEELKSLIRCLEDLTHRQFDLNAFKATVRHSNEAVFYYKKFLSLRKETPCVIKGIDGFHLNSPLYNFMGNPCMVADFFKTLYQEAEDKIKALPPDGTREKSQIRLLNAGHYFPLYDNALLNDLEKENIYFVNEMFAALFYNSIPEPETDTLDGWLRALAQKYLTLPSVGSFKRRAAINHQMVVEWKVDGVVHFLPWGCRVISSSAHAMAEYLEKALNIPSLIIDSDPVDSSIYARGSVTTRLHAFAEMINARKKE